MKEEELKYLLRLLDGIDESLFAGFLQLYEDVEESKQSTKISEEMTSLIKTNLKSNPVTTSVILSYLQDKLDNNDINKNELQNIYQDILQEELASTDCVERIMAFISLLKVGDSFIPSFLDGILKYISRDTFKQHRKLILLSLLPQDRPELLRAASEAMLAAPVGYKLTPEYMLELCYSERTHWLLKAAQVYKEQLHNMKNITFNINDFTKQILVMVLIELTNSPETYDLPSLVQQLSNAFSILETYNTNDEHLQYYMIEVKRELTIIKFCLENNCKLMTTSLFSQLLSRSALAVISQLCRLSKVDRYKISRLLTANHDTRQELQTLARKINPENHDQSNYNWDILTYNSFVAIKKIIDTIMSCTDGEDDVSTSLDEIKRLVLSIQSIEYCVEVIENLFACLFLRYEYFSYEESVQDSPCGPHSDCSYFYSRKPVKNTNTAKTTNAGFICNSLTTQVILNTLKLCLDSLDEKVGRNKESAMSMRYKHLVKVVNHALWKLQLVSTLSPDTSSQHLKMCLDYVEVDDSSDDEGHEQEERVAKKKHRSRRRFPHQKSTGGDQVMLTSTVSANGEGYLTAPSKGSTIDFISLMLAKPICLVALALYHNDFPKANQIIEMFDLADAEIATEVAFTEQLRHLVAKIKNIVHYKDDIKYPTKELSSLSVVSTEVMCLVEGFLASNRAPNSYDIIELAARHNHLQLYNHQNSPFINAVDILISSGLNREITYGLINVVERKLAEVRNSTDVAAVKRTNYIRFAEDIASVTFEIYGNTEKSFEFVDNICELITDCRIPIKHKEFCKLNSLSKELRKSCEDLHDIVNTKDQRQFDSGALQKYHQIYMNVVAASDKDLMNVGEVSHYGNKKTRTHYLRMCYMYCKTVAQLEQTDDRSSDSNTDTPYFSVLEKQLHDIFGNMIKSKDIPITSLEPICKKLNVNLIPKLIMNFCPPIPLSNPHREASEVNFNNLLQVVYDFKNTEENLFLDPTANFAPMTATPDPQCLTYIMLHNWVIAHIVKKIHTATDENNLQHSMDARTKFINNYMELERFNCLKVLFDNNKYLASLHTTIDLDELFLFMPKLIQLGKISQCLSIIDALSEHQLMGSANLMNLRDMILFKLALNPRVDNSWKYCEHLKCPELKVNLIMNHLSCWSVDGSMEVLNYLRFLLDQVAVEEGLYEKCNEWMAKIPLYDEISKIMGVDHWYDIYEKSVETPETIIEVLIESQQFKLCLEWADLHNISDNMKNLIIINLLKQLFEYTNQATPQLVRELLSRLPVLQAVDLVQSEMGKVRDVEILRVCVDFISEHSTNWKTFENIKFGLQIMMEINTNLRPIFWDLIEKPLLMIEQFLMNAKLDVLTKILTAINPNLKRDPAGDNLYYNMKCIESLVISRNAVDGLLRFYAEKALDMKNFHSSYTPPPKVSDDSLLQSIDSISIEASNKPFLMPEQVPSKDQWVGDYATDKCMMCHTSIFSMIIRRHHCRRCGRVVCHACSRNRMEVPTYPSGVKFRVCDDCFTQTMCKKSNTDADHMMLSSNSDSIASGATCMDWVLSTNAKRNEAVRNEFSFEFTPNVTLCLTIMKMHSINLDYPRFLLDRSDELTSEVSTGDDARLIVRARRSLLLAAAELYSRLPHDKRSGKVAETGALHAARCLAHADSMAALVRHAARHLLPRHTMHPSHIVRSLLEAEKWELALDIATKSNLSRNSVLAAWGKACLKAGCYKQAREKFAHCFKNSPNMNLCPELTEECEFGREASESSPFINRRLQSLRYSERSNSMSSLQSEGRPRSNPPLLNEIVSILEEMNYPVNQQLLNKAETIKSTNEKLTTLNTMKKKITVTEPALNIMHTLASVRKIKNGDYSDFQTGTIQPKMSAMSLAQGLFSRSTTNNVEQKNENNSIRKLDPFFYKECVYYLSNYGSHVANIGFYMKHSHVSEVLNYCSDNMVDRESFTEAVFMECLKKDKVNELFKSMSDMDPTLESFGDYITHICRTLESTGRLDPLYQVQCATSQHARAAATCARLYARPVPRNAHYYTLANRQRHLAAAHHHLSNCVPAANKSNDTKSFHLHLDKATLDKHMTTISRQMEVAKYLSACEAAGRLTEKMISTVIPLSMDEPKTKDIRPLTLFGSNTDKIRIVAVVLVAGPTVEDGFNLAFRIMRENKLDSMSVYTHVARYVVCGGRFAEVRSLARCIRDSNETAASLMSDQVLETGVAAVVSECARRGQLHDEQAETLIHDIQSVTIQISCYISCRILSTAYILAAKNERTNDLRRVLAEAERAGNDQIRSACLKRLARHVP